MTWSLIGSDAISFADGNSGHAYTFPAGAPSVGDIDILCVNAITTVTTPTGFTLAETHVGNQGAYLYYRIAAGGEGSSVSVVTNGNFNTKLGWSRWRGGTSFDVGAVAFEDGTSATTSPAVTTPSLAGPGELVVAFSAMTNVGSACTSPVWSSGYSALTSLASDIGSDAVAQFVGYRTDGAGAETPSVTWSGGGPFNRYMLVVAFVPSASSFNRTAADTVTASDVATRTLTAARAATDSTASADVASRTVTLGRSGADTVTASDLATGTPPTRDITVVFGEPHTRWTFRGPDMLELSTLTREYVPCAVEATVAGVALNPTGDTAQMAFVAPGVTPGSGDWQTAVWDTADATGIYLLECLVGPGGTVTLSAAVYDVWAKVFDNPETVVRRVGELRVV